ncbi:5-oxoprolinase/urea amidolyase family protein [Rhizobacter sp. LjRoot28]|uniref:5-oxoprolinase subunit B/C family protein n=1 Tax=Rhizobacter sp. LjRoot28 TaxID=3342309 RepID=UPI003ED045E8
MRFLPASLDALLVELDDLPQTMALLASFRAHPLPGVTELVPAARTMLIRYEPSLLTPAAIVENVSHRTLVFEAAQDAPLVEIEVDYRGEDLPAVAALLGISPREVVERHGAALYTVAFNGFAPGFSYLSAQAGLDVPRRRSPRVRVPAGSVALAGEFSAVYPKESPGGWQLIGTTTASMWDMGRDVPALLQPGYRVRFIDAARRRVVSAGRPAAGEPPVTPAKLPAFHPLPHGAMAQSSATLVMNRVGIQTLLQDGGRPGLAAQGVSASGALDKAALRSANRVVGNAVNAPVLEIVGGGFEVTVQGACVVCVSGADGPITITSAAGRERPAWRGHPIALDSGDRLRLGEPARGVRSYLAARGGLIADPVLGSVSTDTLAGIGPPVVTAGQAVGVAPLRHGTVGTPEPPSPALPVAGQDVVLDVVMGPRTDWFSDESVERFCTQPWVVTPQSNRVGLRLSGATPLTRTHNLELPSEGTLPGSIQVPPNGQPVLFLADHPLTGGYPVIAAVAPHHLDLAGQIPIGTAVRFRPLRPFAVLSTSSPAAP